MNTDQIKGFIQLVQSRLERDRNLPKSAIAIKAIRYAHGLGAAKLYLADVDHVGHMVRTTGRPRIENRGYMHLGEGVHLRSLSGRTELVTGPRGRLVVGDHCSLNGCSIGAIESVQIGKRVRIGVFSMIIDTAFHDVVVRGRRPKPKPVVIEDDVWLTSRCVIMPGVTIGRASVVSSSSVVVKDVPPYSIYAGNPAKKIGEIDPDEFVPEGEEETEAQEWSY